MERLKILVPCDPVPLARARFSGSHVYQPRRNREYRAIVQQAARSAMNGRKPMTGEVTATVKLYRRYRPTTRIFGDVDNHLKAIFDGLNGIAIEDDAQIVRCLVEKFKDAKDPRAEITLESVTNFGDEGKDW